MLFHRELFAGLLPESLVFQNDKLIFLQYLQPVSHKKATL